MTAALQLLLVLLALGGALWLLAVLLMARAILCPPRMNDGKAMYLLRRLSPGDLGMRFENEVFRIRDSRTGGNLHLAGWWIPAETNLDRCVILIHGYADAKVGSIAWAPMLHQLGWNILAIDLRAHGDSEGRYSTAGYFERDDLSQIIDELLIARPAETRQVVLFGISMGAAVAAAVAAKRHDLAGIVLESPFAGYRNAVAAHFARLGLPDRTMIVPSLWLTQTISGARFDEVRPVDMIPKIRCPVLTILGGDDELLTPDDSRALKDAIGEHPLLLVPNAVHLMAMQVDPAGYKKTLAAFLDRSVAGGS